MPKAYWVVSYQSTSDPQKIRSLWQAREASGRGLWGSHAGTGRCGK